MPCKKSKPRLSRLPCLRYKISDSILNRTGLDYLHFYRNHPMVGSRYGDFYLEKDWIGKREFSLDITQDCGSVCHLVVREFKPPVEPEALDLKSRPMYCIPFSIVDADQATDALNKFLDESIGLYLDTLLDDTDHLTFDVFHMTLRLCFFPKPVSILSQVPSVRFSKSYSRICCCRMFCDSG